MKDLIRRSDALAAFAESTSAMPEKQGRRRIEEIPAVDAVEVRHGRWERPKNGNAVFYCSECHDGITLYPPTQLFCYHCGARMDGEDGDA